MIEKYKNHKFLYVSLYGIKSISEIEDQFFLQLHPILSSKGMKLAGNIVKGLIKTSLKIDLDNDGKGDVAVNSSMPDIKLPISLKGLDKCVLVFDDLENCGISNEELLGYINQFVEHGDQKVLLVANEAHLKEKDKEGIYSKRKEKLIGRSFDYTADMEMAIEVFLNQVQDINIKNILKENTAKIKDLYIQANYNNLRHLHHAIHDFQRFYSLLPDKTFEKKELISLIIAIFFILSFEIKKGAITENEINSLLFGSHTKSKQEQENNLNSKYPILKKGYIPLHESLWKEYFNRGTINLERLNNSIQKSPYFESEITPVWMKMWRMWDLEDSEFNKYKSELLYEYDNFKITDVFILMHVHGILLDISAIGILERTKEEIILSSKQRIDKLLNDNLLAQIRVEDLAEYHSYGFKYIQNNTEEFQELKDYLTKTVIAAKQASYPSQAKELLQLMSTDTRKFESVINSFGFSRGYIEYPILKYIDPDNFANTLFKLNNQNIQTVGSALKHRYAPIQSLVLCEEKEFLENVSIAIISKLKDKPSKELSTYILNAQATKLLPECIENVNRLIQQNQDS